MPRTPPTLYVRSRALAGSPLGRFLVRAAALSALFLVGGVVVRQARAQAFRLPGYVLGASSVVFDGLPPWADARVKALLQHPAHLPLSVSVFDPQAEDRVREVVGRHALVRRVEEVRVVYPRSVRVRVVLRVPACYVAAPVLRADGSPHLLLLSTDGQRLDERCYAGYLSQRSPLPVLTGVESTVPPVPGVRWDNRKEQVAEGLEATRVAERLARDLDWGRGRWVARIDVARFPSLGHREGGEVLLVLNDGTSVEWGRTERDLSGAVEEDGYESKAERLEQALKRRPARRIDVRFPADPVLPR